MNKIEPLRPGRKKLLLTVFFGALSLGFFTVCAGKGVKMSESDSLETEGLGNDSIAIVIDPADGNISITTSDSIVINKEDRYKSLTDQDFEIVAKELNVEVAAIKAVVQVEAGVAMQGFFAPGVPVINFDPSVYAQYKNKAPDRSGNKNAKVPPGLSGYGLKEWTQLTNARKVNAQGADMGTFWGMFQIGGFNYKICGCESVEEFVNRMSYSEFEQLQLFAIFIENTGMIEYLRKKDWSGFARRYNGSSYAKRGYHTKMAKAYAKFSR